MEKPEQGARRPEIALVNGRAAGIKDARSRVADSLEAAAARVRAGGLPAGMFVLVVASDDGEQLSLEVLQECRMSDALVLCELARATLLQEYFG